MTFALIDKAGWHFSYLYGIDRIIEKIQNFGDPIDPTDIAKASRPEWLKKCLNEFIDLYDNRNAKLKIIPLDSSFPETILKNKSKYPIIPII
jgi:beta-1,4-mannosyl-glycoprotein beta-1,4-N-acetylglucosaminyltransferase